MKKIVTSLQRILAVICILLTAFTLVSCEPKETMTITEFTQYRDLSRSPDKIKVHYEDDVIGDFEITERAVIDEIITILFDRTVFRIAEGGPSAGNNGRMWLVYGEKEVRINLYVIIDSRTKARYLKDSSELLLALRDYGMEKGLLVER